MIVMWCYKIFLTMNKDNDDIIWNKAFFRLVLQAKQRPL